MESLKRIKLQNWIEAAKQKDIFRPSQQLNAWLNIFDEILSWHISYNIQMQKKLKDLTNLEKCTLNLSSSVIHFSLALRNLVSCGLDVPARHLARAIREYADTSILLQIKPDLANEFIETQDEESANKFWHKHISKQKVVKSVHSLENEIFGKHARYNQERRKDESLLISMASHPSYTAGLSILLSPAKDDRFYEPLNIMGNSQIFCDTPVKHAIIAICDMMPYASPFFIIDKSQKKEISRKKITDFNKEIFNIVDLVNDAFLREYSEEFFDSRPIL